MINKRERDYTEIDIHAKLLYPKSLIKVRAICEIPFCRLAAAPLYHSNRRI